MAEQNRDALAGRLMGRNQRYLKIVYNESGSLLPMAAAGFLVLAGIVGGGVDLSRAHKAENRLQAACDAAVLAGRRAVDTNGYTTAAEAEAAAFFDNNFDSDRQGASNTVFESVSPDNGNTINATASSDVNTTIMSVFGFDTISISVACSASMGVGNSDVTMVLDSTGSMGQSLTWGGPSKLSMLQDAMKSFYDTVKASTAGGSARIRYAFVPYSSSVNVGRLLDSSYLVNNWTIDSREAVYETVEEETFAGWDDPVTTTSVGESSQRKTAEGLLNDDEFSTRDACTDSLPANTPWVNTGDPSSAQDTEINGAGQKVKTTTITQEQTRTAYTCNRERRGRRPNRVTYYVPYFTTYERDNYAFTYETQNAIMEVVESEEFSHFVYRPVTYDVSTYKGFSSVTTATGHEGSNVTSTWDGCIEERETVNAENFTFSSGTGISPGGAIDLDIDAAPGSDDSTKWAPMWPEVAYYRTSYVNTGWGGGRYDMTSETESLTGGKASSFCPQRSQTLQTMTESQFDTYADSLIAVGNTYHDIGMIWGARLSSPDGIFASNVNEDPANGGNVSRHIIFMTDGQMYPSNAIQSSYGIEFHDRRVTENGVSLQTQRHNSRFLAVCQAAKAKGIRVWVIAFATGLSDELEACASSNSSFTADNADELNSAFQEIANEVGELRIVQ